jgi:hypothetical protein
MLKDVQVPDESDSGVTLLTSRVTNLRAHACGDPGVGEATRPVNRVGTGSQASCLGTTYAASTASPGDSCLQVVF